jgi:hypothetical protein
MVPGLLFYLYLPIRSSQIPALDWGNPHHMRDFINHVTAWQYRGFLFDVGWSEFVHRIETFPWRDYWGVGGLVLLLFGLGVLWFSRPARQGKALSPSILVCLLWSLAIASAYDVSDYQVFYYPMIVPGSIAIAIGLAWLGSRGRQFGRVFPWVLALMVALSIGVSLRDQWPEMDVSSSMRNSAAIFASHALAQLPDQGLVIANSDGDAFALMYAVNCGIEDMSSGLRLQPKPGVEVIVANWVRYGWFREYMDERWGRFGGIQPVSPSNDRGAALRAMVERNLESRAVYVTPDARAVIDLDKVNYETEWRYPLYRIIRQE